MTRLRSKTLTAWLHRVIAGAGASLVLLLGVLSVCPEAHAWLHAHPAETEGGCHHGHGHGPHLPLAPDDASDKGCVVELFSQGVDVAGAACAVVVHFKTDDQGGGVSPEELHLSPPRYLRRPERGPPAGR
jgi:hypothetical protein